MDARPVRIYADEDVPRLRYIAGILLRDILGLQWEIITDKRRLGKHPVINYSAANIAGAFRIVPDELLFQKGIKSREIEVSQWQGLPVFFQSSSGSDFPFDIFAASFYLITRYEEYLDHEPDEFGRYKAASSLAVRHGFLGIPIVDLWTRHLARALLKRFQNLVFRRNEFNALLTIDIDQPFAYLGKNIFSSLGGMVRDIARTDGHRGDRYRIVVKGEKDPYEVFDYITEKIDTHKAGSRFFFSVGDHSKFDKNPSWKNEEYRRLIHKISTKFAAGLHPSYNASRSSQLIGNERQRLRTIINKDVTISRFHAIRFFLPKSFNYIADAGIAEDYSMGYPDEPGFRAGISRPFCFYDVSEDRHTNLLIVPFQIMDSALYKHKNLDPVKSREVILKVMDETKRAGGTFVSIWHNTSLQDRSEWKGWREVFEFMLKIQTQ